MPISKRPEKVAWVAFFVALVLLIAATLQGTLSGSRILYASIFPFALSLIFAFVTWWHSYLVRRESEEAAEHERIKREYAGRQDLFEDESEELKLAADARQTFDRWFVTSFTVVAGAVVLGLAGYSVLKWGPTERFLQLDDRYLSHAGIGAFMVLFALLLGSYFNGLSREPGCRWLRPVGAWMLFGGFIQILAVLAMLARNYKLGMTDLPLNQMGGWDIGLGRLVLVVLIVLSLELITNVILEFYRPRVVGEEPKPLYESRLLSFVTEPGSVAQNVADALDYQFGIKVSQTWFYRFLERHIIRLAGVMIVGLYLMDCFATIGPTQMAVRETYFPGTAMTSRVVGPGLHVKLPRPFERMRVYEVGRVHEVEIGHAGSGGGQDPTRPPEEVPEEMQGDPSGKIIVWNKTHFSAEDRFLLASRTTRGPDASARESSEAVPVSFVSLGVTVTYKIKADDQSVMDYAYNYENPTEVLQRIAQRQVVGFLAAHDLFDILGTGMLASREALQTAIQDAVHTQQPALGVEILFVGLAGVHPPPEVAEAYQQVVGAPEAAAAERLRAEAYVFERRYAALSAGARITQEAQSARQARIADAEGSTQIFRENLPAWLAAPSVFKTRRQLDAVAERTRGTRMYFIASGSDEIYILNLEEKPTLPLLDQLDLSSP